MANEITFDKLPQALGYLTEEAERVHKIVAALQSQATTDKHGKKFHIYGDELLQWLSLGERHYRLSTSKSKQHKFSWREEQKC